MKDSGLIPKHLVKTGLSTMLRDGEEVVTHPAGDDVAQRILTGEISAETAVRWERQARREVHARRHRR